MPTAQTLAMTLISILGFCILLAIGAFVGKQATPAKVVTFAGVVALVAVVLYAMYAAYYFVTGT